MKTEVIIVAAGLGQRLKAKLPKALVPLGGRALVLYCLKVFEAHPGIDGIVIVGPEGFLSRFVRLARPFKKVRAVVAGGPIRSDSVKCGLQAVACDTDTVLVHDAARPLIDRESIDRLLSALKKDKAAILGVPVKFTVKMVGPGTMTVQETPARDLLWEAQTPQGFHKDVLVKAHAKRAGAQSTDDAMLVERMGGTVRMVMGNYRNVKVTTPEDMAWARQMIKACKQRIKLNGGGR